MCDHFFRYFTQKASREKKDGKMSDEDSDADSVDDDEFDAFLGTANVQKFQTLFSLCFQMGLVARKPVFGASDKAS